MKSTAFKLFLIALYMCCSYGSMTAGQSGGGMCEREFKQLSLAYLNFTLGRNSGWNALYKTSCELPLQKVKADEALTLTVAYKQIYNGYLNKPHLHKVAVMLKSGTDKLSDKFWVYRNKLMVLEAFYNMIHPCENLQKYVEVTHLPVDFAKLTKRRDVASLIEPLCGVEPCETIRTSIREIKNAAVQNLTFTDKEEQWSLYEAFLTFYEILWEYSITKIELLDPLKKILGKTYEMTNGENVTRVSGYEIVTSEDAVVLMTFKEVIEEVDALINEKLKKCSFIMKELSDRSFADIKLPRWDVLKESVDWPWMVLSYAEPMLGCIYQLKD